MANNNIGMKIKKKKKRKEWFERTKTKSLREYWKVSEDHFCSLWKETMDVNNDHLHEMIGRLFGIGMFCSFDIKKEFSSV